MSIIIRKRIPLLITAISGLIMIADQFIVNNEIQNIAFITREWAVIVSGFALSIAGVKMVQVHGGNIINKKPGEWFYSAILLFTLLLFTVTGFTLSINSDAFQWLYATTIFPLSQVMFSLIAFYMFSAGVRAFRARDLMSLVFLSSTALVVLANIPSMPLVLPVITQLGDWVKNYIMKGVFRAILITGGIGAIILGLHILSGRQSGYLGSGQDE